MENGFGLARNQVKLLSVIVPIYDESRVIEELFRRLKVTLEKITPDFEVIFVDDGSKDDSLEKMIACHSLDKRFKILVLSRNFGHQAAYTAGLSLAKGQSIAMMDGDLQDPPEVIPEMHALLESEKADVVYGKRIANRDGLLKKGFSKVFHRIFADERSQ